MLLALKNEGWFREIQDINSNGANAIPDSLLTSLNGVFFIVSSEGGNSRKRAKSSEASSIGNGPQDTTVDNPYNTTEEFLYDTIVHNQD